MKLPGVTFNEANKGCLQLLKALNTQPDIQHIKTPLSNMFLDTDKAVKGLINLVNTLDKKENKK